MEKNRLRNSAYEYLCHLEEARRWMESVLKEPLPPAVNLEEGLQNGVYLAKLANFIAPDKVPLSRIYDIFQHRYRCAGLQFRHTDNINYWIQALESISFPNVFMIETSDVYNKKNMPKLIYCIHALSFHLFGMGLASPIQDLFGKIQFKEEDINLVSQYIEENRMILPSFKQIGGLLGEHSTSDVAKLQTQLQSINKIIDEGSERKLLEALDTYSFGLIEIEPKNIGFYMKALKKAKAEKVNSAKIRCENTMYRTDVSDVLLSNSEIQGHIREVNIDCIYEDFMKSLRKDEKDIVKKIISSFFTLFKDYREENIQHYIDEALKLNLNNVKSSSPRDIIQAVVRNGNRRAKEYNRISEALGKVKEGILCKNKEKLLNALRAPALKLSSQVSEFAAPLYLEELQEDLKMSEDINYADIKTCISVLNEIAKLTSAVDCHDCEGMWRLLSNPNLPFMNVEASLKTQYLKTLCLCRQNKLSINSENSLLTFADIQECVDITNLEDFHRTKVLMSIKELNEAVRLTDNEKLLDALQKVISNNISVDDVSLYSILLKNLLETKQASCGEELWLDDVISVAKDVKSFKDLAFNACEELNKKMTIKRSKDDILKSIENHQKSSVTNLRNMDEKSNLDVTWVMLKLTDLITVYLNPNKRIFTWSKPVHLKETNIECVMFDRSQTPVREWCASKKSYGFSTKCIIKLQSAIRGYLVRRRIFKMSRAAVIIQRWWRKIRITRKEDLPVSESLFHNLNYYSENVGKIIKIQAFWRGYQCRKTLSFSRKRTHSPVDPSFQMLKHLALTRQINHHNYSIDLKVQAVKSSVVNTIKINQDLAHKLEEMDVKIGLLVQNRMSVEAIVAENRKTQCIGANTSHSKGLKSFSKGGKKLLDGYQQLFYLLQTDPTYLTRLIVRLPSKLNHVIQSCVFSLFNYGTNSRDSYLLLRLFRSALFEEVQMKFEKPADAITGNPLVLRLAVAFARQAEGHNPLRQILGFLIEKESIMGATHRRRPNKDILEHSLFQVLNDKVFFDINPVDIYRRWVNQMETESGKLSHLPQSVTQDEALSHPEVVCRLNHNLRILKSWVKCFLERLLTCVNQFPYALRFTAKLLKNALSKKFSQTPEKDILKIVGNLVYYQYINSAIVAPDAFHTISLPPDQPMKGEQRRNLASIAKILHFAATKMGFGEESKYLMCLNPFIVECHKEMKRFCQNICAVDDLEEHYHITKYSEASRIDKPRIYMTLEEIRECHKLMLEVREEIAPDPMDPIHEILDDLGDSPSLATLVGCENSREPYFSGIGKMQVCLELDNKFQSPLEDPTDAEKLFIKTKELITSRLNELDGETMAVAVAALGNRDIVVNLAELELKGLVSRKNDYQEMVKSILQDVIHEQERRMLQKQELNALTLAQRGLNEKRKFYEEQLSHYEEYLKTCLKNLRAARGRKANSKKDRSLRYSGTRLREKGILVSLDGVPPGQLKNVQFEISETPLNGVYSVHGRFMGVEVEKIDIDIQELLKLQFEGYREIDLFGKALINVNLLLHLLNKKFHART